MTSMIGDIPNRVRRLPKPTRAAEALQPLFEAVSNALHAVEDAFGNEYRTRGRITVSIKSLKKAAQIEIVVADNGIGLSNERYRAFCTTDTDYKSDRGGKGIGRLLWLDAFKQINVTSQYNEGGTAYRRSFSFKLTAIDQIADEKVTPLPKPGAETGTTITFKGLRIKPYESKFPVQPATLLKHFGSHFFADFILGKAPEIIVDIDGDGASFPDEITRLKVDDRGTVEIKTETFDTLLLANFVCNKAASANFDGLHQLHLVANGRTVLTRKIDGLIGIGRFGPDNDLVYHGCVTGVFLNERVNQERTHFNFDESVIDEIVTECASNVREHALKREIIEFDKNRLDIMKSFVNDYPSFGFQPSEELLARTPKNAIKPEQFAQALIPLRIRRDKERNETIQRIVNELASGTILHEQFAETVRVAADEVRAEEQRQLTEYVLRRKIVLDVLAVLIRRVRQREEGPEDFHLEKTLHQFICPMRVRGDNPAHIERSSHDLWIIDERLAFAKYFASDLRHDELLKAKDSSERMDLFVFERLHGLGFEGDEPLRRVMLVEFKRPGRKDYDENYSPGTQITRYISKLRNGEIENFKNERIRVADDCIYYCYVIADIVGRLEIDTSTWRTTSNGRGRVHPLEGKYRGTIEIIEWRDLISDARMRNHAFIHAAGARYEDD